MGIDGNFAGGFSQGAQPIVQGLRQDRRDASQRAFKEKLITEDRTAQSNIRQENQKIRSDKDFMANLFRTQQQGTENDRFVLQQGLGRTLQDAQRTSSQTRSGSQKANNVVLGIEAAKSQHVKDRVAELIKSAPGNIVSPQDLAAATQQFTGEADQRFGRQLRDAKLRANDLIETDRLGGIRLEELQNEFQSSLAQISDRNSLKNIASSNRGKLLQQTFGKTDDDIAKLFGEIGEPTQQNGIDLFGTASPSQTPFDVDTLTPEKALAREREFATQAAVTKQIKKASTHSAIKQVDSLDISSVESEGAKNEVLQIFGDLNKKLSTIVEKNPKDKLTPSEIETLSVLFRDANALSDEELGGFAAKNQKVEDFSTGKGLKSRFALNQITSPAIEARVKALQTRVKNINPELEDRTRFAIRGDEFKPKQSDDLNTLVRKSQAWQNAGKPVNATRTQNASQRAFRVEKFFRDAIQNKTDARKQQGLVDSIEAFRQRLVK